MDHRRRGESRQCLTLLLIMSAAQCGRSRECAYETLQVARVSCCSRFTCCGWVYGCSCVLVCERVL